MSDGPGNPLTGSSEPAGRAERRPVNLDGRLARADGSTVEVGILDLNYDGCGITTPVSLEPGEALKLAVTGRGLIAAEVRWCKDGRAGLRFGFDEPQPTVEVPRGNDRTGVSTEVRVRRMGRASFNVKMFDLSPSGCRIEVVDRPLVGDQLLVKFDGLEVMNAEVCWIEEQAAGLRFERPLHPAVFDLLVMRLQ